MTTDERIRNLRKARKVRARMMNKREREKARAHRLAVKLYAKAVTKYRIAVLRHGEGSRQEKEAFARMIRAEGEWFRTHPENKSRRSS